ncbi:hypothetical protein ACOB7R_003855 [Enterobacter hormaechei]|nr:hypothetical protein [Enterobacter hormaechei subsp. hoffmannii]
MKKITSKLTALDVGHVHPLELEGAATILTDLPTEQIHIDMDDSTAFRFSLSDKQFTLINTGCGSLAIRTN